MGAWYLNEFFAWSDWWNCVGVVFGIGYFLFWVFNLVSWAVGFFTGFCFTSWCAVFDVWMFLFFHVWLLFLYVSLGFLMEGRRFNLVFHFSGFFTAFAWFFEIGLFDTFIFAFALTFAFPLYVKSQRSVEIGVMSRASEAFLWLFSRGYFVFGHSFFHSTI